MSGSKPKLLDLFCCAGVGAEGYDQLFDVTGVDMDYQPRYPYNFIQADVLTLDVEWIRQFDAIAASPPCQFYTELRHRYASNNHPALIPATRELLQKTGRPFVIENVENAKEHLVSPVLLCGTMFDGLRVFRHRLFEANGFTLPRISHESHSGIVCHTFDRRKAQFGFTDEWVDFVMVNGGGNCSKAAGLDAMGVGHRSELLKRELNEGIPPAYTAYVGRHLYNAVYVY